MIKSVSYQGFNYNYNIEINQFLYTISVKEKNHDNINYTKKDFTKSNTQSCLNLSAIYV